MTLDEARMIAVVAKTDLGKTAEALNVLLDRVGELECERTFKHTGKAILMDQARDWVMFGKAEGLKQFAQELRNRCPLRYCLEADLADQMAAKIEAEMKEDALRG